jgi:hypothetical protein
MARRPPRHDGPGVTNSVLLNVALGVLVLALLLWRQGTWLTLVLWLVAVGLHFGIAYLSAQQGAPAGLGSSTILAYLAVTLGIQRFITQRRALKLRVTV